MNSCLPICKKLFKRVLVYRYHPAIGWHPSFGSFIPREITAVPEELGLIFGADLAVRQSARGAFLRAFSKKEKALRLLLSG